MGQIMINKNAVPPRGFELMSNKHKYLFHAVNANFNDMDNE
jgi:hypothetical protein